MDNRQNTDGQEFMKQVETQEQRKLKAKKRQSGSIWRGLGLMGLVGWSVALPVVAGAALGRWLDHHHPTDFSWTLAFITAGLVFGGMIVWRWVTREDQEMHREEEENQNEVQDE